MHNPFLVHSQQLRQHWKDLRIKLETEVDPKIKSKIALDFWNQAPTSKPFLDYMEPSTWPDPWTLLDNKIFDANSISLGIFWTLQLGQVHSDKLTLAMLRQPSQAWEGLVCIVDDQLVVGYDRHKVWHLAELPDMRVMHMYKYDLQKRCIREIPINTLHAQVA